MIEPRKLILMVAVMATVGSVFQFRTIPYPLTIWSVSPLDMAPSYKTLNQSIHVRKFLPQATSEQFPLVVIAPVISTAEQIKPDSDPQGKSTATNVPISGVGRALEALISPSLSSFGVLF